jgi:hypothetical protein
VFGEVQVGKQRYKTQTGFQLNARYHQTGADDRQDAHLIWDHLGSGFLPLFLFKKGAPCPCPCFGWRLALSCRGACYLLLDPVATCVAFGAMGHGGGGPGPGSEPEPVPSSCASMGTEMADLELAGQRLLLIW